MKRVDKGRFIQWLKSHRPHEFVGFRDSPCDCPVARWLKSTGYEKVNVRADKLWADDVSRPCPRWVRSFIGEIDKNAGVMSGVQARTGLRIMATIEGGK